MRRLDGLLAAAILSVGATGCAGASPSNLSDSKLSETPTSEASTSGATDAGGAKVAENPFGGDASWVAYHGYDPDRIWIGLVHPDGSGNHRIETGLPGDNLEPGWSPDGTRLAFGTRGGDAEALYEYTPTAGTTRQLFACQRPCLGDAQPTYAPDGKHIAFVRYLGPLANDVPSDCGIWVGDLESGWVRQLTSHTDPPCDPYEGFIEWSPDGKRLLYHREIPLPSGKVTTAIYTTAADGTDERRMTNPDMVAGEPAYSPDGKWIVFCTYPLDVNVDGDDSELYRMRSDGSRIEQLTHFQDIRACQPSYSPDGDWIIFSAVLPSRIELWAIPAAGGEPVVILDDDVGQTHGTWQPSP